MRRKIEWSFICVADPPRKEACVNQHHLSIMDPLPHLLPVPSQRVRDLAFIILMTFINIIVTLK